MFLLNFKKCNIHDLRPEQYFAAIILKMLLFTRYFFLPKCF